MPVEDEIEITEMFDMSPTRLDGVRNPANGVPFLAMKAMLSEELDEAADAAKAVADYAYAIKAKYSAEDLSNAIRAVGRGSGDHNAIRKYIMRRAKAMGMSSKIPDNWNSDGSTSDSASKASDGKCSTCDGTGKIMDGNRNCPDCDGTGKMAAKSMVYGVNTGDGSMGTPTPMEAPDGSNPTMPGSSAWEKQDADNLIAAGQMLAQVATMLSCATNREQMEVATGGGMNDMQDVMNLSDAMYYVQQALGIVGFTAFTEENESMMAAQMESASKSQTLEERRATLRQTIEIARKAMSFGVTLTDGAAAGSTTEVIDMEMTQEEFDTAVAAAAKSAVAEAVPDAVAAGLAKYEADRKASKAAKSTGTEVTTGDAGATGDATTTTTSEGTAAAKSADTEVIEMLKGMAAKQSELEAKVDAIGNATAKKAITSPHAAGLALRGQEGIVSENEAKKAELKDAIVNEPDPAKAEKFRTELSRLNLREQALAAGAFS